MDQTVGSNDRLQGRGIDRPGRRSREDRSLLPAEHARALTGLFGLHLDLTSPPRVVTRLREALLAHDRGRSVENVDPTGMDVLGTGDTIDIVWVQFDPAGRLAHVVPFFDESTEVRFEQFLAAMLTPLVCDAYEATREVSDHVRPAALSHAVGARLEALARSTGMARDALEAARAWCARVLHATMVSFERIDNPLAAGRLVPPQFLEARSFGPQVSHFRFRSISPETADLWLSVSPSWRSTRAACTLLGEMKKVWGFEAVPPGQMLGPESAACSHAGSPSHADSTLPSDAPPAHPTRATDGARMPAARRAAGTSEMLPLAPPPAIATLDGDARVDRPWTVPWRVSGDSAPPFVYSALEYIDGQSVVNTRDRLRAELSGDVSEAAMLVWALSHHPAFIERPFTFPLRVLPGDRGERPVTLHLTVQPSDFVPGASEIPGFIRFHTAIVEVAAKNPSEHPTRLAGGLLRTTLRAAVRAMVGSSGAGRAQRQRGPVGVSVMSGVDVVVPPLAPQFVECFIGFAGFDATGSGPLPCAVSFKGSRRRVEVCREAVLETLEQFSRYFPVSPKSQADDHLPQGS